MSRTSHRTRIHDVLRSRLLQGEIAPGARLVDHAIAAEMGVSRMPVREALMQLVSEGYLESTSRGFALPNLSPDRITEVFVLRRLLEPHAVAGVARDRGEADLATMGAALALAEGAGADVATFHRGAEGFRNGWLGAVRNAELRQAIQRYSGQVQSVRFATLPDPEARATILAGLCALHAAFLSADGLAAQDRMLRFIYDAEESYRRGLATGLIALKGEP
ncbi:GntR family transcriptional regulator [Tabrizicola sp.]|uniref:GntR family transcriptional regulator n=1 Tax=Tabrizicola sp. TaxID=2005166 RepID=UPI001A416E22|nr:GntR family transcriptional regulator [Tabrizicola sp.]MBL9072679.1 GntR family transcriptional regulator [Tabrizicola sp.]